jgi:hypothetical protein
VRSSRRGRYVRLMVGIHQDIATQVIKGYIHR